MRSDCLNSALKSRLTYRCAAAILAMSLTQASIVALPRQMQAEELTIDDPRPLGAAVLQFERRCHCIVTYEDLKWREEEVEDISGLIHHTPGAVKPLIPKGRRFAFTISNNIASEPRDVVRAGLQQMIAAFERANGAGTFRLMQSESAFHIVPKSAGVLDVPISFDRSERSLGDTISTILSAVTAVNGEKIKFGTVPINLMKRTIVLDASKEPAADVLSRALKLTGRTFSWRLLYDFGLRDYALNLHSVR